MRRLLEALVPLAMLATACGGQRSTTNPASVTGPIATRAQTSATMSPAAASSDPASPSAAEAGSSDPATSLDPATSSVVRGGLIVIRVGQGTSADGLLSLDPASGRVLARLPVGVPDPSWTTVYTAAADGSSGTVVSAVDLRTGRELRRQALAGQWHLAQVVPGELPGGLAEDGTTLVLVGAASGAASSRFALLDPNMRAAPKLVTLDGSFDFDALSPTGGLLYLIEHLPTGSGEYQVRSYDVNAAQLSDGPIVDKRDLEASMAGRPVARATTHDGQWVETIYVRTDGTAFVHQLDTADAIALCVDLPGEVHGTTAADAQAWRIALTGSDGGYVANGRLGFVANVQTGALGRTETLPPGGLADVVATARGDAWLLTASQLRQGTPGLGTLEPGLAIQGRDIAATSDGSALFVLTYLGTMERIDIGSGAPIANGSVTLDPGIDWTNASIVGVAP